MSKTRISTINSLCSFSFCLFYVALLALSLPKETIAESPDLPLDQYENELGKSLREKVLTSLDDLQSGMYTVERTTWLGDEPPHELNDFILAEEVFCVFDHPKGCVRSDHKRRGTSIFSNPLVKYYSTPDSARLYTPETGILQIIPPDSHLESRFEFGPLKLRILGLSTRTELKRWPDYSEPHDFFKDKCFAAGTKIDDNHYLLSLYHTAGQSAVLRKVTLDASRNYVPIEFSCRYTMKDSDKDVWQAPWTTEKLQWKQIRNVWVPISLTIETENGETSTHDKFEFDWHLVNDSIPDKYFTEEDLKSSEGTLVVDASRDDGNPEIVSRVEAEQIPTESGEDMTDRIITGILVTILFALIVVSGILALRWKRSR